MPLGLWKSKWEIHREDFERYRQAQNQAVLQLVDRFGAWERRWPDAA